MQRIVQDRIKNDSSMGLQGDMTLELDRESGIGKVIRTDTQKRSRGRSGGKYRKHRGNKTALDFTRYRKSMMGSLLNNYGNNRPNVRFLTLTFADNRIKTIDGAKSKFNAYIKTIEKKYKVGAWTLFPEYNSEHKPHLHVVIRVDNLNHVEEVKEEILSNYLVSHWEHGTARVSKVWDIRGLCNYLVPTYDTECLSDELKPDNEKIEMLTKKHHEAKNELKALTKDTPQWVKSYVKKKRHKLNQEKKKELQKQLKGDEKPVYKSYGQNKTIRIKTNSEKIHRLWKEMGSFSKSYTITTTINSYDDDTGELMSSYAIKTTIDSYTFTLPQCRTLYDVLKREEVAAA